MTRIHPQHIERNPYLVHPIRVEPRLVVDEEHPAAARQRVPLHRQSSCIQQASKRKNGLGASGGLPESLRSPQEETGLGASGGRPAISRVAPGTMRKGLRIARRHTDRYPGAVSTSTAGCNSGRIGRVAPGPMRRGLRIAIGGMPSGPRAVVFTETPSLSYSPFSSCSPAAPRRTRSRLVGLAESEFYGNPRARSVGDRRGDFADCRGGIAGWVSARCTGDAD